MDEKSILQVDEFVRSINVNKNSPHALLLGASASLSSGVPSAGRCVEEWKRDIFVTITAIAGKLWLDTDAKHKVWEKSPQKTEKVAGRSFQVHRCMEIDLRFVDNKMYLTVDPTFHIPSECEDDRSIIVEIKKRLIGWQHNDKYNSELDYWRSLLSKEKGTTEFDFPPKSGAFKFELTNLPAFASITRPGLKEYEIPDNFASLVHHKGFVCEDPKLVFGKQGSWDHGRDKMPLRGISSLAPFDNALNLPANEHPIRLSVICPKAESGMLEQFLDGIEQKWQSAKLHKEDYLVPYGGFEKEFRVPIEMPKRSDTTWFVLPELTDIQNHEAASRELARNINLSISCAAAVERSIVLILTPKRWENYRRYENSQESFDVHDYVQAYAAQRGIATQFLTQEKLAVQDKCRFWWWFSVAI